MRYGKENAKCWAISDGIRWYIMFRCHGADVQPPLYFTNEARMRQTVDAINEELQVQAIDNADPKFIGIDPGGESFQVLDVIEHADRSFDLNPMPSKADERVALEAAAHLHAKSLRDLGFADEPTVIPMYDPDAWSVEDILAREG